MKPTQPADRVVVNIKDAAAFKPFKVDGAPLPGQSFLQIDETFPEGSGFHIYRMEPGAVTQPHEHTRVPSRKRRQTCRWHFRHLRDIGDTRQSIGRVWCLSRNCCLRAVCDRWAAIARHRTRHEQFLVLDGEMIENDGTVFKAGDFVLLRQGTQHNSWTETGCKLAVFVRTTERNL